MIVKMLLFERDNNNKIQFYSVENQIWKFPKVIWMRLFDSRGATFPEIKAESAFKGRLCVKLDDEDYYVDCCFINGERYLSKEVKALLKQGNVDINLAEYDLG